MTPSTIVIAGPTGSGKSELALRLALATGGEIVNYDSVQIYRGFDIGSAKPSAEERRLVPHHLFDIIEASDEFNAADYGKLAREVCRSIHHRGRHAILVGGTFFYLRAFLSGLPEMPGREPAVRDRLTAIARRPAGPARLHRWLSRVDPRSGGTIAPADRHRVERALEVWITSGSPISAWRREEREEIPASKIGLTVERTGLTRILDQRVEGMYQSGLIAETCALRAHFPETARPFGAIGYREALGVLKGQLSETEAIGETKRRTRAYSKRQMTWLRSERNVHWIEAHDRDQVFEAAKKLIEGHD